MYSRSTRNNSIKINSRHSSFKKKIIGNVNFSFSSKILWSFNTEITYHCAEHSTKLLISKCQISIYQYELSLYMPECTIILGFIIIWLYQHRHTSIANSISSQTNWICSTVWVYILVRTMSISTIKDGIPTSESGVPTGLTEADHTASTQSRFQWDRCCDDTLEMFLIAWFIEQIKHLTWREFDAEWIRHARTLRRSTSISVPPVQPRTAALSITIISLSYINLS